MPRTTPHVGPIGAIVAGVLIATAATALPALGVAGPGSLGSKSHTVGSESHTVGSKSPAKKANLNLKFVSAEFYSYTNAFYNTSGTLIRVTFRFDCSSGDQNRPFVTDASATLVQGSTTARSSVVDDPDSPTRIGGSGETFCTGKNTIGYAFFDPAGFQPGPAVGSVSLFDCDLTTNNCQQISGSDAGKITGTPPKKAPKAAASKGGAATPAAPPVH